MSKPANVIQIIDSLSVGGAEMMAVNIANGLSERKINSHLCVTRGEGLLKDKIDKEVSYLYLEKKWSLDVKAVIRLKKYILKNNISVVHVHSTSVFFCFFLKLFGLKSAILIWHNHTGANTKLVNGKKFKVLKKILNSYKYIINVSSDLNTWCELYLQFKNTQLLSNFPISNNQKITRLKLETSNKIIILAALRKEKDHLNLFKAFKTIQQNHKNWTLHIVGKTYDDFTFNTLKKYLLEHNIEKKVFFYNTILDTSYVLSQADIAVLSSNSEGLPVSLLEYGLAGLPVVVTDVGECKKVVGDFGFVVPKENSETLANAILNYVEDEKIRELKAKQFQKHIFENYSEDAYFSKLLNLYHSC